MTLVSHAPSAERPIAASGPGLTVVIVPLSGPAALRRCLAALARQRGAPTVEIIVPHDDALDATPLAAEFPEVRFLALAGRHHPARLRAAAVARSGGGLVALTEDHCVPDAGWCAAIVAAHERHAAVIGGVIDKAAPAGPLEWALYLCDYVRYMPPSPGGEASYLSDCNVSYDRAALEAVRPVWSGAFHETVVHDALRDAGLPLLLSPTVLVRQGRAMRLNKALADRLAYGRLFASTRARRLTPPRRWVRAAGTALLPAVLTARVIAAVLRRRRHVGPMIGALPAVLVLTTAWALGELGGYLRPSASTPDAMSGATPAEAARGR